MTDWARVAAIMTVVDEFDLSAGEIARLARKETAATANAATKPRRVMGWRVYDEIGGRRTYSSGPGCGDYAHNKKEIKNYADRADAVLDHKQWPGSKLVRVTRAVRG